MKKMLRILWLLPLIIYFSTINVNTNQFALVVNPVNNKVSVYSSGIHFILPLIENVYYIGATAHNELYTLQHANVEFNGKIVESAAVTYLINWQVIDPLKFYQLKQNNTSISVILSNEIKKQVTSLHQLNSDKPVLVVALGQEVTRKALDIPDMGLRLNAITVAALNFSKPQLLSNPNLLNTDESSSLVLESAYYEAGRIINQTALEKSRILGALAKPSPKFYDYFRRLEAYRENPLCIKELPPFNQLYLP